MSELTPDGEASAQAEMVAIALDAFDRAIRALDDFVRRVEAGEVVNPKELKALSLDAGGAFRTAFEERRKVEEHRKRGSGRLCDLDFDLDGARDEICRRLDRLRAAQYPDRVS